MDKLNQKIAALNWKLEQLTSYEAKHGAISSEMAELKAYYENQIFVLEDALAEAQERIAYVNPDINPITGEEYKDLI